MYRVVSYDYPIDNNEEMKMKQISVEDIHFDEAVVGILTKDTGPIKKVITLDLDPYENECVSIMHYTAEQARELAAALIKAAEEVEKQ